MRILHVLEYSMPHLLGYSIRSAEILKHQRALGWETVQLTSPAHSWRLAVNGSAHRFVNCESVDGWTYHRTRSRRIRRTPTWFRDMVWTHASSRRATA